MSKKTSVYIAGPLTSSGRVTKNVNDAVLVANELMLAGLEVYVPHLTVFQDAICPQNYEFWLEHDLHWLEKCDVLLRLPGDSAGADREVQRARELGMYVYYSIDDLKAAWQATIEAEL